MPMLRSIGRISTNFPHKLHSANEAQTGLDRGLNFIQRPQSFVPLAELSSRCFSSQSVNPIDDKISETSLKRLFSGEIYAIVIPNYVEKSTCIHAAKQLLDNRIREYSNAPGIGRIGLSFYETQVNKETERRYFDLAISNINHLRGVFAPFLSPIDKLRLEVDEAWPYGAKLGTHNGNKMFAGLCRALEPGKGILPHEDKFERDTPLNDSHTPVKSQIGANIYLQNGTKGGDIELYKQSLDTPDYDRLRGNSYGISRNLLPPPLIQIHPEEGSLVLFNSRRLHAVTPTEDKLRLTVACFVGYRGDEFSLKFWS